MKNTIFRLFLLSSFLLTGCSQKVEQSLNGDKYYRPSLGGNVYIQESSFYSFNGNVMSFWESLSSGEYLVYLRFFEKHGNVIWAPEKGTRYGMDEPIQYDDPKIYDIIRDMDHNFYGLSSSSLFGEVYNGCLNVFENPSYLEVQRYMTIKMCKRNGIQVYNFKSENKQ